MAVTRLLKALNISICHCVSDLPSPFAQKRLVLIVLTTFFFFFGFDLFVDHCLAWSFALAQ